MDPEQSEEFAERLSAMDRQSLVRLLREVHCNFDLDFTDEFLRSISLGRLRHLAMGALLHATDAPAELARKI